MVLAHRDSDFPGDLVLPMRGRQRREFFNAVSSAIVLGCGVTGALIGFCCFGLLGGLLCFGAGVMVREAFVGQGRFYRG
jgi:hypothetical protein